VKNYIEEGKGGSLHFLVVFYTFICLYVFTVGASYLVLHWIWWGL